MEAEKQFGYTALTPAAGATIRRLAKLEPRTLAVMHGSSYSGAGAPVLETLAAFYDDGCGRRRLRQLDASRSAGLSCASARSPGPAQPPTSWITSWKAFVDVQYRTMPAGNV